MYWADKGNIFDSLKNSLHESIPSPHYYSNASGVVMNSGGYLLKVRFRGGRNKDYGFLKGFGAVGSILDAKRTPRRHMLSESELKWC